MKLDLAVVDAAFVAGPADVTSKAADLAFQDVVAVGQDAVVHTVMDVLGSSGDTDSHTCPEASEVVVDHTLVVHVGHDSAEMPPMLANLIEGYGRWVGTVAACVRLPLFQASLNFTRQFVVNGSRFDGTAHLTQSTARNPECYMDLDGWWCNTGRRDEVDRWVRRLVGDKAIDAEEVACERWRAEKRTGPDAGLVVAVAGSWGEVVAVERCSTAAGVEGEPEADPVADDVDDAVTGSSQSKISPRSNVKSNAMAKKDASVRGMFAKLSTAYPNGPAPPERWRRWMRIGYRVKNGRLSLTRGERRRS